MDRREDFSAGALTSSGRAGMSLANSQHRSYLTMVFRFVLQDDWIAGTFTRQEARNGGRKKGKGGRGEVQCRGLE